MYGALTKKPTTLWVSGFKWDPKPRCGTLKKRNAEYWKCGHLLKNKTDNRPPHKVENMTMEEKVVLPKKLVKSLLEAMLHNQPTSACRHNQPTTEHRWVLALFESYGSWWGACYEHGLWHVSIAHNGVLDIDEVQACMPTICCHLLPHVNLATLNYALG